MGGERGKGEGGGEEGGGQGDLKRRLGLAHS